jgi:hypothetical protein
MLYRERWKRFGGLKWSAREVGHRRELATKARRGLRGTSWPGVRQAALASSGQLRPSAASARAELRNYPSITRTK